MLFSMVVYVYEEFFLVVQCYTCIAAALSLMMEKNISLTVTENIILSGRAWLSSPSFSGYKNNIVIRENGAIPSRQSNMDKPRFRAVLDQS
ncbi:Uncharacterized protein HZ326_23327 [Fusarium oxysporum f. sp. albedinis]|nr:Uncharacterized protein HZ326_23327 [Fusarium oxysporum f. sp. albedinis]